MHIKCSPTWKVTLEHESNRDPTGTTRNGGGLSNRMRFDNPPPLRVVPVGSRLDSCSSVTFQVGEHLMCIVAEHRPADGAEQRSEDEPAWVATEGADPGHIDAAAVIGGGCGDLPTAPRYGVDVGVDHGRDHPSGLGPVVAASLPVDADACWSAFADVRGRLALVVDDEVLLAHRRPHPDAAGGEVVRGVQHALWRQRAGC